MAAEKSREEDYEEWLGRMDIPIERQTDMDTFRTYLKEELGITADAQVEALWSGVSIQEELADLGIRGVTIDYAWGRERRYGIQGMPGLWGWDAVKQVMEAEE